MNANSISRPVSQQSAQSWTPLLAAVLLAIALIVGVAGVAALTAKTTSTTSPIFRSLQGVPYPGGVAGPGQLEVQKTTPLAPVTLPTVLGYEWINGEPHAITAPVVVPQSVNIDAQHAAPYAEPFVPQPINSHDHQIRLSPPGMGGR